MRDLERALDRGALAEFDMRLAFPMNPTDSRILLDSEAATRLVGASRALYLDVERMTRPEKCRPYALPSENLIQDIGTKLKERWRYCSVKHTN